MQVTGFFNGITQDWETGKACVTFKINERFTQAMYEEIKDSKLSIEVEQYKEKRSLNANKMLWACLGDIATAMTPPADKWDVYLEMLKRYGKYTYICVKPNAVDSMKAQWRESEVIGEMEINGQKAVQMLCYFGSSTMNTKEFSVLLDGVISEMKEMGLPTPPSQDMKRALEQWGKMHEKTV